MRRFGLFIVLVLSVTVMVTAVTQAQTDTSQPNPIPSGIAVEQMIDGRAPEHFNLTRTPSNLEYLGPLADPPTDTCVDATRLFVVPNAPGDGGVADVARMTEEESDHELSCMWGNPVRPNGFRTVWYKLVALNDRRVTFDTFNSTYDTVLSVYTGECGNLTQISCNDDNNGFSSRSSVPVSAGTTYYIEVADRSMGIVGQATMQLSALMEPVESRWSQINTSPFPPAISRHATVVQGDDIYVIGGETVITTPELSNKLYRLNAWYNTWTELAPIPGGGYANTTAARLGNQIYLPSGFNGADNDYDGIHWQYDILKNEWKKVKPIPRPGGRPFAWAAAAAHPSETYYFLTGGITNAPFTADTIVLDKIYSYTQATDAWNELVPSMNSARYAHTADWVNNRGLCVAGGLGTPTVDGAQVLLASAECYLPGGTWTQIGELNIPRFGAGSAVGPDGRWYVFGGTTIVTILDQSFLVSVARTEVYDPIANTWEILPVQFNLGNNSSVPARNWPRGEFVGNYLWVIGGSIYDDTEQALPLVEKMYVPSSITLLPIIYGPYDSSSYPDDTVAQARDITFGAPQERNFDQQRDFFDFFTFYIPQDRHVRIYLDVPDDNNFDLELYDYQKFLWRASDNTFTGEDEEISIDLTAGRYYILVKRLFPTGQPDKGAYYRISTE